MRPVNYSGANATIVSAFEAKPPEDQSGDYWSADEVKALRAFIKTHYIAEQQRRCCYCDQGFATDNHGIWECEHVIAKTSHPQWLFTPHNLAVACKDCNNAKRTKSVLKNKNRKTFPTSSSDYLIVHPHFDEYHEHIRWIGTVPRPNGSEKGKNTIYVCDLLRFASSEAGLKSNPSDRRYDKLVGDLMGHPTGQEAQMILAALAAVLVPQSEHRQAAVAAEESLTDQEAMHTATTTELSTST